MIQFRKLMAVICVFCLLAGCFAGCSAQPEETAAPETSEAVNDGNQSVAASENLNFGNSGYSNVSNRNTGRVTNISLDPQGHLQITRDPAKSEPMGDPNTWTIFVYLCGSDLESEDGLASGDLQEMIDGSLNSCVRYIIMTGGSLEWHNTVVDNESLGLFLVEDGDIVQLDSWDNDYMNNPEVLHRFLDWGVENYPAEKMGLVIWDHGGGSVGGVCVDGFFREEINSGEREDWEGLNYTLTLPDISGVLSQVYDKMTDQFEFVGYDACLMGTLENAFMLSSYARYMYASEESEPGYGWDYVAIGEAIGESGEIRGDQLGKVVCDSFYQSCADVEQEENATLSCVDLSRVDDLIMAFDAFAVNMMAAAEEPSTLAAILQRINRAEFFGGNSEAEGYFNLIDLGGAMKLLSSSVEGSAAVQYAIKQAVTYHINGKYHSRACGLSFYYPLNVIEGSAELSKFAEVACSPYYYGYVAQTAYAAVNGGMNGYDSSVSMEAWASAMDADVENIIEDYGAAQITGESPYVVFCDEPHLSEDGTYGFSLEDDSIPYIDTVEAFVFFLSDDEQDVVLLGSTTDIIEDWDTGVFTDHFDGLWFCLPDGQLISSTVILDDDDFTTYTTPVLINGEESNLRFVVDNSDYTITLDGVWTGEEDHGFAGRNTYQLKPGDVIVPIFTSYDVDTQEEGTYYGEEYIYDGATEWLYGTLFDSDYIYLFRINDIYGDYFDTEPTFFQVKDGELFFYPDEE